MKKRLKLLLGGCCIVVISFILSFIKIDYPIDAGANIENQVPVGEITKGTAIQQKFSLSGAEISGLKIKFGTYRRFVNGQIEVILEENDTHDILYKGSINMGNLRDNAEYLIEFEEPIVINSEHMMLRINGVEGIQGECVTIFANGTSDANNLLTVNGEILTGSSAEIKYVQNVFSCKRWIYLSIAMSLLFYYVVFVVNTVISHK